MISIVTTVYNDAAGVAKFFEAMSSQTLHPDEIVIVDAGSSDGTWEAIEAERDCSVRDWHVHAELKKGCNVAQGRNLAIKLAKGEIIVSTDIGCDWASDWLETLTRPLLEDPEIELAIGSWAVLESGLKGNWALTEWALKGDLKMIADNDSYSSSRSIAYRKEVWIGIGGYPEDLSFAADDAVFHYLLEKAFVKRTGVPQVTCFWHRHSRLKAFLMEQRRYGRGDGEAGIRFKDFALTGGRLLFELGGVLGLAALFFFGVTASAFAVGLSMAAIGSILWRFLALQAAVVKLVEKNVQFPRSRLALFVYLTKTYWIFGYLTGMISGARKCRNCRRRLATINRETYMENIRRNDRQ